MRTLVPTHQVFNGAVGALTGDGAFKAKVGETVLMVHNSCNVDSRPRLIGGHGDYVWESSFTDPSLVPQMAPEPVTLSTGARLHVQKYEVTVAEWNTCHDRGGCALRWGQRSSQAPVYETI